MVSVTCTEIIEANYLSSPAGVGWTDRLPWNFPRLISTTLSLKSVSRNFDIGDPRSGQFCDFSIISQWEKIEMLLFWTKTIWNTLKHRFIGRVDTLNRNIATSDPSSCHKVISGHERSPAVFRQWLARVKLERSKRNICVQADHTDRLICNMTFSEQVVTLTVGQIFNMVNS